MRMNNVVAKISACLNGFIEFALCEKSTLIPLKFKCMRQVGALDKIVKFVLRTLYAVIFSWDSLNGKLGAVCFHSVTPICPST